ncbi:MAG: hypothetical protein K2L80_00985, partial [Muribaculaceae bacterium]|nr:hypothetical protein [Muribaculaceae bacterium]
MYKAGFSRHISWLSSLCDHLKNGSIPYSCRTVYEGRNKVIACKTDSEEVNIKIFRKPGILKSIIYGWLRPTKARRSFNHSLRLLDAGIATCLIYTTPSQRDSHKCRKPYKALKK